jgi:cephalosporin hydroxylase
MDIKSSVDWLIEHYTFADLTAESWEMIKQQAKAMHKEEQSKFTIDYFNWLHNNQYKYNPKVKMYQKMMINETLFFTIEKLMIEFNKTFGGNNEQQ